MNMAVHPDMRHDGTLLCRFDDTEHRSIEALHAHLKRFRVSREKYYTTYHCRKDRMTGQPIPYKGDWEAYLSQAFSSKVTMKQWLSRNLAEGLEWSKGWLAQRKREKGLIYAPSQTELRTLQCPSVPYYDTVAASEGGYYGVTRALGFADRYDSRPLVMPPLDASAKVIQDTREQDPITLPLATIKDTVSVGDYALAAPHDKGIRIERKSLGDFCGTLSHRRVERKGGRKGKGITEDSSYQRFERELKRAQEQDLYVVMMVEASITDAQRFDYLPQTQWIKASPSHIFHGLRTLLTEYPLTFQCLFVDGRIEMARVMPKVFRLGDQVKTTDLQLAYEQGRI
jgi:hypothetical protein